MHKTILSIHETIVWVLVSFNWEGLSVAFALFLKGLGLRLPISTSFYQTQQERTTKLPGTYLNQSLSQPSHNITTPTVVYSEPLQCFYHYCYRCTRLSLLIPVYVSLKQHPASIMRFSTILAALLAPLCAQAVVEFTNNAYNGIADGVPFTLTWSGDGTVCIFARLLRTSY